MSIEKIVEQLIAHDNRNVDEFNELYDRFEELNTKYQAVNNLRNEQDAIVAKQQTMIRGFHEVSKQHQRDYNKLNLRAQAADIAEIELKKARKELKPLREQVKRLKAANVEKEKKISRLEGELNKRKKSSEEVHLTKEGYLRNPNLGAMYTLFVNAEADGELLQLYPHRLTMRGEDGKQIEGYVLVHTNDTGTLVTVILDSEHVAKLLSPLDFSDDTPDRTRNLANKFLRGMSPEATAFANQWLYRVNVTQKGELTLGDLERSMSI